MENIPLYQSNRKNILVLSGGGIKGLATLGALKKLKELKIIIHPEILCGSSVGSLICLLLNIGYNPEDIYNILEKLDFAQLIKCDINSLFESSCLGINSPDPIIYVILCLMEKKNINQKITFKELFLLTNRKLIITGTCVNDISAHYFSVDYTPDMMIINAIRISISIPFIFKPFKYDNKIWVDGGCMNDYPIDLFTDKLNDVVGIYLDDEYSFDNEFNDVISYSLKVMKCIAKGLNLFKLQLFDANTIKIVCDNNLAINWEITSKEKKQLFDLGYQTVENKYKI